MPAALNSLFTFSPATAQDRQRALATRSGSGRLSLPATVGLFMICGQVENIRWLGNVLRQKRSGYPLIHNVNKEREKEAKRERNYCYYG